MAAIRGWNHPAVKEVRGRGLMIAIDIDRESWPVLEAALARGLLLLSAGEKTLRLLPPYIISDSEIEQGLEIMRDTLNN
jgi:acetylornithine/succinyldiaminopimelate/putrescine aminotransferase